MVLNSKMVSGDCSAQLADEIVTLRYTEWKKQISPEKLGRFEFDFFDRSGWHRILRDPEDGKLVATSRLYASPDESLIPDLIGFSSVVQQIDFPAAFLNRSVVHHDYRRRGIWKEMIQQNLDYARSLKLKSAWLETSEERLPVLYSMGFELVCPSADTEITGPWFLLKHGMDSACC